MDRSLDDSIAERQRGNNRDRRAPPRKNNYPRDGVRKSARNEHTNLENDWVHDRYDDDERGERYGNSRTANRPRRGDFDEPKHSEPEETTTSSKIRVENLHYDITEDELYDLFGRIATVESVKLVYDRAGRSNGTAFVIYSSLAHARSAIREYDGANAKGQPIRLELLPPPAAPRARRDNPFERTEKPRSLFDRIENTRSLSDRIEVPRRGRRARSASPGRGRGRRGSDDGPDRRSDVTKPPPDGIDRYVPRHGEARSSSHRGLGVRDGGRRPGERRERGGARNARGGRDTEGPNLVNGRPRKTQGELDAEMDDYWGSNTSEGAKLGGDTNGAVPAATAEQNVPVASGGDDDIDMIE